MKCLKPDGTGLKWVAVIVTTSTDANWKLNYNLQFVAEGSVMVATYGLYHTAKLWMMYCFEVFLIPLKCKLSSVEVFIFNNRSAKLLLILIYIYFGQTLSSRLHCFLLNIIKPEQEDISHSNLKNSLLQQECCSFNRKERSDGSLKSEDRFAEYGVCYHNKFRQNIGLEPLSWSSELGQWVMFFVM